MKIQLYERLRLLLTGIAYFTAGILIITHPRFFYYWVAAIFLFQGAVSLLRSLAQQKFI